MRSHPMYFIFSFDDHSLIDFDQGKYIGFQLKDEIEKFFDREETISKDRSFRRSCNSCVRSDKRRDRERIYRPRGQSDEDLVLKSNTKKIERIHLMKMIFYCKNDWKIWKNSCMLFIHIIPSKRLLIETIPHSLDPHCRIEIFHRYQCLWIICSRKYWCIGKNHRSALSNRREFVLSHQKRNKNSFVVKRCEIHLLFHLI